MYRATEQGKARRREQRNRARMRAKERCLQHAADSQDAAAATSTEPEVGHHKDGISEKSCCFRPGCYVRFPVTTRSPRQCFCSSACVCDGEFLLIDSLKRLAAARSIKGFDTLRARSIECDERSAKAALYNLNRVGRGVQEIEEVWIVQALIREDGLSQVEVAELLSHHKSWVCRRLALLERLCPAAWDDLSLGLLSPTQARQLVRLTVEDSIYV